MMPIYGMDAAGTCQGYGKVTDFIHKKEVSDMIQHNTIPILKNPGTIGWKMLRVTTTRLQVQVGM